MSPWGVNSLRAWKDDLQKRHRSLMARRQRLEGKFDVQYADCGRLIEINAALIAAVQVALKDGE